ncbi:alkaline phosphatase family protein [Paenarthrobacter sp. DKR-5]|uniref:alkaline phosphatase family protein n=1 Tax=Paenarthrobacter sp. DKR-5 TaxID=2835535 RepID=UPI001BDCC4FD|nr:alkaline phosphatase family protein [Paenarthrobacter sp. DKR-5]MBT1001953.1 alkaline phosphatase family protein [Paenarthrobacter sp. DKR-5]
MNFTRRNFLTAAGSAAAAGLVAGSAPSAANAAAALPAPASSGIDHIIVLMMENRSFDHFLGWTPGADGSQSGLSFIDRYGIPHSTHHLTDFQGCGHPDPDHSYEGGRIQFNNGRNDGWLRAGENDEFAVGYYTSTDLDFWRQAVPGWTVCDRYFAATMAETYPNRFYQHAAATDRTHNSTATSTLPTIWDRLAAAGVDGKYYYNDIPFTALWGTKYMGISHQYSEFLADCSAGKLPAVSFVDPRFTDESSGTSGDDHPHADIRSGQQFLAEVYNAVTTGPNWANTMLVINYDEWGGFYDHVAPTTAPDTSADTALRGFRVPAVVVSPRARRGYVAHDVYDHTSVLKAIEWRFGLAPLTPRDQDARNIAEVLDFGSAPNLSASRYSVPAFVAGTPCSPVGPPPEEEWSGLKQKAIADGWKLP